MSKSRSTPHASIKPPRPGSPKAAGSSQPQSGEPLMRIAQAARAAGVATQSVEYYIMIGVLTPIRRGRSRFFDSMLVNRIKLIHRLNKSGYTLRSIRETYLRGK